MSRPAGRAPERGDDREDQRQIVEVDYDEFSDSQRPPPPEEPKEEEPSLQEISAMSLEELQVYMDDRYVDYATCRTREDHLELALIVHHEVKRGEARTDNLCECAKICGFFLYLLFFSITMFLEQSESSSLLADHIRMRLDTGSVRLGSVTKPEDFYSYMEEGFLPALFTNDTDMQLAEDLSPYMHPVDLSNRVVGSVRVRQVRVQQTADCQVGPLFSQYSIPCYPRLTAATESTASFGPDAKFRWSRDSDGASFTGSLTRYSPSGFMQYLSGNKTAAEEKIRELKNDNFLGSATRAVFVEFAVWSSNIGKFAQVTVCMEFDASKGAFSQVVVLIVSEQSLRPGGNGSGQDVCAFIGNIVIILFVFYYIFEEAKELKESRLAYFLDGWNVMDWTNMLLILAAFVTRIIVFNQASSASIGSGALLNKDSWANIKGLAVDAESIRLLMAVNSLLLWVKCTKYLRNVPVVKDLIRKIWQSLSMLGPFLFMFSLSFFGFALAYNIGFGDTISELSSFTGAFVYLGRAFLLDVELMPVYYIKPQFGAFMILFFYVTLVLVGLTSITAIFADAIFKAKVTTPSEEEMLKSEYHEDEPVEEVVGITSSAVGSLVMAVVPPQYRMYIMKTRRNQIEDTTDETSSKAGSAKMLEDGDDVDRSSYAPSVDARSEHQSETLRQTANMHNGKEITRETVLRAIELMSGRILSEISIVGIEIKSELNDICERVAQMQMAVEELTWRVDKIREKQAEALDKTG